MFGVAPVRVSLNSMVSDFQRAPIDAESAERVAVAGLRLGLVDTADRAAFSAWLHADVRGIPRRADD